MNIEFYRRDINTNELHKEKLRSKIQERETPPVNKLVSDTRLKSQPSYSLQKEGDCRFKDETNIVFSNLVNATPFYLINFTINLF